jgi:hypothetical protein
MSNNFLVNQLVQAAASDLESEADAKRKARNKRKAARRKAKAEGKPDTIIPIGLGKNNETPRLEMIRSTASKGSVVKGSVAKNKIAQIKKAVATENKRVANRKKQK